MSRLARTIFIVLCAVTGANSADFYNFGADIVREITLLIEFIWSNKPNIEINLDTNEKMAGSMVLWLQSQFYSKNLLIGSLRYQKEEEAVNFS